ncbi:unnamed protein product [Caenorhabditis bovis]|uniref:Uncharacterized protein n=1 Tax=Caenorhabditis bovis TaxID=2654633 RepID=A0A8S1ERI2_9PELO|nr:unnamed protein product [Caenorhabditis bovis]
MYTSHTFIFIFLLWKIVEAQSPTCPNGQLPKLDKNLKPIQCLPGTFQHAICGPNHNCFFTGLNYMCCPSNEPSIDNQPTCPYPKLTVLDAHGLPLKCSALTRHCPEEHMHCSDVGLGYICCENPSFQRNSTSIPTTRKSHSTTTPRPKKTLECPEKSIGLLKPDGSRIECNSQVSCEGDDTFCYGDHQMSICCQKYLFASDILNDSAEVKKGKTIAPKLHEGEWLKPTTKRVPWRVDQEYPEIVINSIGVRRSGAVPFHQKPSEIGRTAEIAPQWTSKNIRMFSTSTTPTTTTKTTTTSTTTPRPTSTSTTTKRPISTTRKVPVAVTRRSRLNGIANFQNPEFRTGNPQLLDNRFNHIDRHEMAQKLLSYQIRNGWPYDERFYRPDTDVYTPEQRSEIARMRFLPQH